MGPALEIIDEGSTRLVRLRRPVHVMGRRVAAAERRVPYSADFLRALEAAMGEFAFNELEREFNRGYLRDRMEGTLRHLKITPASAPAVLDFGCGFGASTLILSDLSFPAPTGSDVNQAALELARRRAAERGRVVHFEHGATPPEGPFDLIFCNAVLEHLTPPERADVVARLWRALRPGGHLIVQETPNRLFPVDRHTTGLPLLPLLPVALKLRLSGQADRTAAFRTGVHGVAIFDFDRWIPRREREDRSREADPDMELLTVTARPRRRAARFGIGLLKVLTRAVGGLTNLPEPHLYPYLLVCFRKKGVRNRF